MNPGEVRQVLVRLLGAFPMATITEETPGIWVDNLAPVSFEAGWNAALALEKTSDRFPSIAVFLEQASDEARRLHAAKAKALPAAREPQLLDDAMRQRVHDLAESLRPDLTEAAARQRGRAGEVNITAEPERLAALRRAAGRAVLEVGDAFDVEPAEIVRDIESTARDVAVELVRLARQAKPDELAALFGCSANAVARASLRGHQAIETEPDTRKRAARAWARAFGSAPPFVIVSQQPEGATP